MNEIFNINLQLFDANPQTTAALTNEMKTYYSDYLIDNARPKLVHGQFGQKKNIPQNGGKTIEFRKYSPLAKATTALTEGVTPDGQSLTVSTVTATVAQYGGYITLSDMLTMTAIDNNIVEASEMLGAQAGSTLDTIVREVLVGGNNVQYGESAVAARYLLVGGESSGNHYMSVDCIKRAVRSLKAANAAPIKGDYIAVIHPDVSYDLMSDSAWQSWNQYTTSDKLFAGEIGRIAGCRFVETTEAKIFHAADLSAASRTLSVASCTGAVITLNETLTAGDVAALTAGTKLITAAVTTYANPEIHTIVSATTTTITVDNAPTHTLVAGDVIYPGDAGAKGRDVYATLVLGANAYGITEVTGGGLEVIVNQLGSGGATDPLNQRASVGWKATQIAEILVDTYMVRLETASTFESGAN